MSSGALLSGAVWSEGLLSGASGSEASCSRSSAFGAGPGTALLRRPKSRWVSLSDGEEEATAIRFCWLPAVSLRLRLCVERGCVREREVREVGHPEYLRLVGRRTVIGPSSTGWSPFVFMLGSRESLTGRDGLIVLLIGEGRMSFCVEED